MINILKNMKYEDQIKRITNRNIFKSNHLEKNSTENVPFIIRTQLKISKNMDIQILKGFRLQIFIKLTISKIRLSI